MAFNWIDNRVGLTPVTTIDDEAKCPVGTRAKAYDSVRGPCEFIYLPGVASVVADDAVVYNETYATTRTVAASRGPIAFFQAAIVADKFGWAQIAGLGIANSLAANAADVAQFVTATAGSIDDAVVAAQGIAGCVSQSAVDTPATGKIYVALSYPYVNGDLDA
jgi:hypothetical protein